MYAVLLLGGNVGESEKIFESATQEIDVWVGGVKWVGECQKSPAWGYLSESEFSNQIVIIQTQLTPREILQRLEQIEREAGRIEKGGELWRQAQRVYADRTLDIDILYLFDHQDFVSFSDEWLEIPHPRIQERDFVVDLLTRVDFAPYLKLLKSE